MKEKNFKIFSIILIVIFFISACGEKAQPVFKKKIFTGILPQKYFAERIAGGKIEVYSLVGQGQNPHNYEPLPAQMRELSQASAYFETGLPFEEVLVEKIKSANSGIMILDLRKGITLRKNDPPLTISGDDKKRGETHDHEHGEFDPHIWLSPELVKIQARTICEALSKIDPTDSLFFYANLDKFNTELDSLQKEIQNSLSELKKRKILVFHPAFGYFADSFNLEQIPIEAEGKEPGPRQLMKIEDFIKKEGIGIIFVQAQFSPKSAEALASEIGCIVVTLDPLAENWEENMRYIAKTLKERVK